MDKHPYDSSFVILIVPGYRTVISDWIEVKYNVYVGGQTEIIIIHIYIYIIYTCIYIYIIYYNQLNIQNEYNI